MEELFDTFDINGNFIGVKTKSFCHSENPKVYHKPVWIWILNDEGKILVQKRASTKMNSPNKYDISSAGHVVAGETLLQACVRETKEELGIDTSENDYIFLREWVNQKGWELAETFLLKTNAKLDEFKLQKQEVAEVKYLTYEGFVKLINSDSFCSHDKEYKDFVCKEIKKYIQ